MISPDYSSHPVLSELLAEVLDTVYPDPWNSNFKKCLGKSGSGTQCEYKFEAKLHKRAETHFKTLCTKDSFYDDKDTRDTVEVFLEATHCFEHRDKVTKKFRDLLERKRERGAGKDASHKKQHLSGKDTSRHPPSNEKQVAEKIKQQPEEREERRYNLRPRRRREDIEDVASLDSRVSLDDTPSVFSHDGEDASTSAATSRETTPKKKGKSVLVPDEEEEYEDVIPSDYKAVIVSSREDPAVQITWLISRYAAHFISDPIVRYIEKPFTIKQEKAEGVVYVFKRFDNSQFFKVGFSENSAKARLEGEACWKDHCDIVYESRRRFVGAKRVEILVHAQFHSRRLRVQKCWTEKCKKRHQEWIEVGEAEVVKSVKQWESWVHGGAYVDGMLTDEARELMQTAVRKGILQVFFPESEKPTEPQEVTSSENAAPWDTVTSELSDKRVEMLQRAIDAGDPGPSQSGRRASIRDITGRMFPTLHRRSDERPPIKQSDTEKNSKPGKLKRRVTSLGEALIGGVRRQGRPSSNQNNGSTGDEERDEEVTPVDAGRYKPRELALLNRALRAWPKKSRETQAKKTEPNVGERERRRKKDRGKAATKNE